MVNHRRCVIVVCQYRSINCNKSTTLADHGEATACVGSGIFGKSLYLPFNFAVNLKLLLKNSFYLKKMETEVQKKIK